MNADDTNSVNLTNHPAPNANSFWSPDRTKTAFTSNGDGNWKALGSGHWEAYVMNADGVNPINFTNHRVGDFDLS